MVTKKKSTGKQKAIRGRVKVGKLQLNKETIKDLTGSQRKQIKGGAKRRGSDPNTACCVTDGENCRG